MGIIRKEKADEVAAFSFGDEPGSPVQASNWRVAADGPDALPAPDDPAMIENGPPHVGGEVPADKSSPEDGVPEAVSQEVPPPIFEIPEDVLSGFYEQVVMAGLEDGKNQVLAELSILQERFSAAIEKLGAVSRELASQNQSQILALACKVAERLVRDELKVRPERLLSLVADAIANEEGEETVVVRCSPGDHDYISSQRPELEEGVGSAFKVRIELDETLEYGDFQIETRTGQIDGRVAARIDEVQKSLEESSTDV